MTGYKGFFYHFLDMDTGARGGDERAVDGRHGAAARRRAVRAVVLRRRRRRTKREIRALGRRDLSPRRLALGAGARAARSRMGWSPEDGLARLRLAAATTRRCWSTCSRSARRRIRSARTPGTAWTSHLRPAPGARSRARQHLSFPPLFGHQYSHVWIDFRGIQDAYMRGRGIDYFENSRRAVYAQRAYAIANPQGWTGYGENVWGLTACDGPADVELRVRRASRACSAPTRRAAPASNTCSTTAPSRRPRRSARIAVRARDRDSRRSREMHRALRRAHLRRVRLPRCLQPELRLRRAAAATAASSPGVGWVDDDYLGIDQGPIVR